MQSEKNPTKNKNKNPNIMASCHRDRYVVSFIRIYLPVRTTPMSITLEDSIATHGKVHLIQRVTTFVRDMRHVDDFIYAFPLPTTIKLTITI